MKDRVPAYPGRVRLLPVSGQTNVYDLARADEPLVEGTPISKITLLSDETAKRIWPTEAVEDKTVNNALSRAVYEGVPLAGDLDVGGHYIDNALFR